MIVNNNYKGTGTIAISEAKVRTVDTRLYFSNGRLCMYDIDTQEPIDVTNEIRNLILKQE